MGGRRWPVRARGLFGRRGVVAMHHGDGCGTAGSLQEGLGILLESGVAAAATKVIRRAAVVEREAGLLRIHGHAADRVAGSDGHELMIAAVAGLNGPW